MKTLEEFELQRNHLLDAYDHILLSGILPVEETGVPQVEERRSNLLAGRFILAVCGRINAGKSTLLNSLLFEKPVLPSDDTPHTSKNSLIEYSEKESLRITFYNSEEWNSLNAEMGLSSTEVAQKFRSELEAAANEGIYKDECIRSVALVRTHNSLSALHQYVTPVVKGGKFSPFVKEVTLFYPHTWLRSVTVADTPGVDDPYKFREDQTKRFVTQADSILYVSYAGQAMAQPDFNFLNEYLLHVSKDKRVIALNKIDIVDGGIEALEAYLRELSTHSEPSIREVFGTKKSIVFVCALAKLISQMESSGLPLSDELSWYKDKFANEGMLHPEKNGIDALKSMVEEHLVSMTGKDRIDSHSFFIDKLLERKIRYINTQLTQRNVRLKDLGKTSEELEFQIKELKKEEKELSIYFKQQKEIKDRSVKDYFSIYKNDMNKIRHNIVDSIRADLQRIDSIRSLPAEASWSFTRSYDSKNHEMKTLMDKLITQVEQSITDFSVKMKGKWIKWDSGHSLDEMIDYETFYAISELSKKTKIIAEVQGLEKIRKDSTVFWERWFNLTGGRNNARTQIINNMENKLNEFFTNHIEGATQQITKQLSDIYSRMENNLRETLSIRIEQIDKLSKNLIDKKIEQKNIENEIKKLNYSHSLVEKLKNHVHKHKKTEQ